MASDRLIEFLAGADLQGSIVRFEVDAIDLGAQSIGERRPLKVVDDPCPRTSVGVEVVAEATEGVTQSSAFVLPGVGRQRRLEHPGCSEEIDDLPSALEAGSSVVVGCVDQNLADAFRLAHGARASSLEALTTVETALLQQSDRAGSAWSLVCTGSLATALGAGLGVF